MLPRWLARARAGVTRLLYRDDPYLLEFDATRRRARASTADGRRSCSTAPPSTRRAAASPGTPGTLGDAPRGRACIKDGDDVLHVLDALPVRPTACAARVDAARRRDHRQQHHGQHLLSRALRRGRARADRQLPPRARPVSIDLDRPVDRRRRSAQRRGARERGRLGSAAGHGAHRHARRGRGARRRACPTRPATASASWRPRASTASPAAGTHPRTTSEVGVVVVLGHERYKGGTRVRFVCGIARVAALHPRARRSLDETSGAAVRRRPTPCPRPRAALRDAAAAADERACRTSLERALEGEAAPPARRRARRAGRSVVAVVSTAGRPPTLRALAGHVVAPAPASPCWAAGSDKAARSCSRARPAWADDVAALLKEALARDRRTRRRTRRRGAGRRRSRRGRLASRRRAPRRRRLAA